MNYRYRPTSDRMLAEIVARHPRATLHDIRRAHPKYRAMSVDQLGLRLGDAIDRQRDPR